MRCQQGCFTLQVMIDVMVAAGEERWGQQSGLVMLLPHGYDGQVRRLLCSNGLTLSHMPAMASDGCGLRLALMGMISLEC